MVAAERGVVGLEVGGGGRVGAVGAFMWKQCSGGVQPLGVLRQQRGPPEPVGGGGAIHGREPIDVLAHEPVDVRVVAGHVGDPDVGEHDEVAVQPVVEVASVEPGAILAGPAELEDRCGRPGGDRGGEQLAGFVAVRDGELDRSIELGEHVGLGSDDKAIDGIVRQDPGLRPPVVVVLGGVECPVHHVDVEVHVVDVRAGIGDRGDRAHP